MCPRARHTDSAAVAEAAQPPTVAKRLIAWLEAVNSGNEDINDPAQAERHLEVLFEGTVVTSNSTSEGAD